MGNSFRGEVFCQKQSGVLWGAEKRVQRIQVTIQKADQAGFGSNFYGKRHEIQGRGYPKNEKRSLLLRQVNSKKDKNGLIFGVSGKKEEQLRGILPGDELFGFEPDSNIFGNHDLLDSGPDN